MIDRRIRTELGRCYSRLRVDHDDLAQSIHTKLLVALRAGRFEARSTLAGYVTAIVHHVAISRLRGLYRERAVFEPAVAEARDPRDNPSHAVVADEIYQVRSRPAFSHASSLEPTGHSVRRAPRLMSRSAGDEACDSNSTSTMSWVGSICQSSR